MCQRELEPSYLLSWDDSQKHPDTGTELTLRARLRGTAPNAACEGSSANRIAGGRAVIRRVNSERRASRPSVQPESAPSPLGDRVPTLSVGLVTVILFSAGRADGRALSGCRLRTSDREPVSGLRRYVCRPAVIRLVASLCRRPLTSPGTRLTGTASSKTGGEHSIGRVSRRDAEMRRAPHENLADGHPQMAPEALRSRR